MPTDGESRPGPNGGKSDAVDVAVARRLASSGVGPDPARLVAEVSHRADCDLSLVGVAEHGDSGGALYVRWPDGREGVLTRSPASLERMRQTAEVLAEARVAGLPVPRHDVVVQLDSGVVAIVQERLPGTPAHRIDAAIIDAMVATNEQFAGLLAHRPDVPIPAMHLRHSEPDRAAHELLEQHSDRSRQLLDKIREIGQAEPHEMTGDDLVHPDYTFGNVLYDDRGQVSGLVDWNWGALRGDRHFALVRIYVDLFWHTLTPGTSWKAALDRLDDVVRELIDPTLLRMYWAHITLNQLTYWISDNNADAIERFLRFGEYGLLTAKAP